MYFFAGHALNAEYVEVAGTNPEQELVEALADGPARRNLKNFVPEDAQLESAGETEEQLKLTLSDEFWELPVGERYAAAAQVVFTMAVLEEGKRVFLLDDVVPGAIVDGDGDELAQPLSRTDFEDVRPWVEVQQPAAGAVLSGDAFPVVAEVRGRAVAALVDSNGTGLDTPLKNGEAVLRLPDRPDGEDEPVEASVVITVIEGGRRYVTNVPVTLQL